MGAFLVLAFFLVLGILGSVYAPEIRKAIHDNATKWQSKWDDVNEEIRADEEAKEAEHDPTSSRDTEDKY